MQTYLAEGEKKAFTLGNRSPVRYTSDGKIDPAILDAYWHYGFYVFEGVLGTEELADIEADLQDILERLPSEKGSPVDASGRPALAHGLQGRTLYSGRNLWGIPLVERSLVRVVIRLK